MKQVNCPVCKRHGVCDEGVCPGCGADVAKAIYKLSPERKKEEETRRKENLILCG